MWKILSLLAIIIWAVFKLSKKSSKTDPVEGDIYDPRLKEDSEKAPDAEDLIECPKCGAWVSVYEQNHKC